MNNKHLRTILKINGLGDEPSESDVREVLSRARYSEEEIAEALLVLQGMSSGNRDRVGGLHSVLFSDAHLGASEIVNLLGIDIQIEMPKSISSRYNQISTVDGLIIIGLAIVVAVVGITLYMYISDVGLFHSGLSNF